MAEGIEGADEGDKGWLDASSSSDRLHIAPSELGPATAFL